MIWRAIVVTLMSIISTLVAIAVMTAWRAGPVPTLVVSILVGTAVGVAATYAATARGTERDARG